MAQNRCEMSMAELKQFDGTGQSDKLYVAVNGKIFDVTDKGYQFYGKGTCAHIKPTCLLSRVQCCQARERGFHCRTTCCQQLTSSQFSLLHEIKMKN